MSKEDGRRIHEMADMMAQDWGTATISKPYSSNPLDDLEDDEDEDEY